MPLIISVPGGIKAKTNQPVELLSLYPTLIDLCALPANPKLEGVSLRTVLGNPKADWEHVAISTLGQNNHAAGELDPLHAAVIERLKKRLPKTNLPQRN